MPVHLSFAKYGASKGGERSGAYLFLPDGPAQTVQNPPDSKSVVIVIKGPLESRVQVNLPYVLHETIMRTVQSSEPRNEESTILEIRNLVDVANTHNTELVMRIATDISNKDEFFTDLNGLQIIRRKRFDKLPLQANYYPVPSAMYVQDESRRLTVISGQALGGTSPRSGTLEIMQDRRLNQDDNRGLDQGVLDNKPVLHHFKLLLEIRKCQGEQRGEEPANPAGYLSKEALLQRDLLHHPIDKMLYSQDGWPERMLKESSLIKNPSDSIPLGRLPADVFLASLLVEENSPSSKTINVLMHKPQHDSCIRQQSDDDYNSMMNFSTLFNLRRPKSYIETTITFLKTLSEAKNPSTPLRFCPMDIKAVRVDF